MKPIELCEKRKCILETDGHLLIEGGPGSGKTTIALLKAQNISRLGKLKPFQKILFLSFARATISRVEEHAKSLLDKNAMSFVEVNTYHGFSWSIIQNYGYLVSSRKTIRLITPPNAVSMMAKIPEADRLDFQRNLFQSEGLLCFDLFAEVAGQIVQRSKTICNLMSDAYPVIIVDEFQDTNAAEWELIMQLGLKSKIVALADLQQRIYDFRGASIVRIPEFNTHFKAVRFDLGKDNHRSGDTDIANYGDDLLTGVNKTKAYNQVSVIRYKKDYQNNYAPLKYQVLQAIERLRKKHVGRPWSMAILVKSKLETLLVSGALSARTKSLPPLYHEVLIDPAGPSLAAGVIGYVLQPISNTETCRKELLSLVINHLKGRKGDRISQASLTLADALETYLKTGSIRGKTRLLLVNEIEVILLKKELLVMEGIPAQDWIAVRNLFQLCSHESLTAIYEDSIYLRLLNKGALLNEELAEKWRTLKSYRGATGIIETALLQEHFSMANRSWHGIFVMTVHKSKGKEFDEVIIWEDNFHPFVSVKSTAQDIDRTKLTFRVGVTRAKERTIILTCRDSPCPLL